MIQILDTPLLAINCAKYEHNRILNFDKIVLENELQFKNQRQ